MLLIRVTVLFIVSISVSQVAAQASGAPNCTLFTTMSEEHGKKAQAIEQDAAERARTLSGEAARSNADIAQRAAKSEWEMAALNREAARKCLQDFLAGGQQNTAAPAATTAPVQQVAPAATQVPVVRQAAPVVIQQPAPVVIQQAAPVQQFHSTAVSAMALGGAALSAFGNRGNSIQQAPAQNFSGQQGMGQSAGAGSQGTQTITRSPDGGVTRTTKNPDGSEKVSGRYHIQSTSQTVIGSGQVSSKGPGGERTSSGHQTTINPDGSVAERMSTTVNRTKSGIFQTKSVRTGADGTVTTTQDKMFRGFTMNHESIKNPDGTVSERRFITRQTPAKQTAAPAPTAGRPTAPVRAVGKRITNN